MLETVYYIGQTIAVIAILCSLGAIWWQQRETNKIARADMTERVLGKYSEAMRVMAEDPDLAGHYSNLAATRQKVRQSSRGWSGFSA